jgi:hypothetical protein
MRYRCRFAATLTGALALAAPLNAAVVGGVRTVALSGQPAPGTSGDVYYHDFLYPLLNAAGEVAFRAVLGGSGVTSTNNGGIWSEGSGNLELVARKGSQAPGAPSGVNYSGFGREVLNAAGELAFGAGLTGAGVDATNGEGIWSGDSAGLQVVARAGDPAAGIIGNVRYDDFTAPTLNAAGQTAFQAFLRGDVTDDTDSGIWAERSGSLALVAREGSPAPGTPSGVNFRSLGEPILNAAGQTAFHGSLSGTGIDATNDQGIWSEASSSLDLVARGGSHAPGTPPGVNFNWFSRLSFNSAGQTAFSGRLVGSGVDATNDFGIWSQGPGSLTLVAREGGQAPGLPAGVNFMEFGIVLRLNDAGQTSFSATLAGSGVDSTNNRSIWSEGSGNLALVARTGDHAPGTAPGIFFAHFRPQSLNTNSAGQIAFVGEVRDTEFEVHDLGIWATDRQGELQLIVRESDQIEVAPSDFRTVDYLQLVPTNGNEDGRRSGFNDNGQIVFWARFTDDSTGVFVSNVVAIPEPASLLLACIAFAGWTRLLRRA